MLAGRTVQCPWKNLLSLIRVAKTFLMIYLFGVLCRFQHCTGHITTGSWKVRGNQYIQFIRVLYCKLPTNGKQLPAFPLEAVPGTEPRPQRWEARVLPLCHRGPDPSHETTILTSLSFQSVARPSVLFRTLPWGCSQASRSSSACIQCIQFNEDS